MKQTPLNSYKLAEENDLTEVLNQIEEGILWVEFSGKIIKSNRAASLKTGYSPDELSAMEIFGFCNGFTNLNWYSHINKLHKSHKVNFKCTAETKSGKTLPISVKMILSKNGYEPCICIIVKDLEKIKQENANMQRVVYEYDKLSYRLSHDLRSPISSVLGLVNLMEQDSTEEQKKCLKLIVSTLEKQTQLMNNINNLSSIHTTPVQNDEINFQDLINLIVSEIPANQQKLKTQWLFDFESSAPFFNDQYLVSKLLESIIDNAAHYSRIQSKTSEVTIKVSTDQKGAHIEISDNGFGIDPVIQNQIFGMFFRGSAYSKGSGLGLYFVKVISEKLNGTVDFDTDNNGTTFKVFIPNAA